MLIDLLRTRRSIRRFKDQPVEQEKLDLLLEAALRAPTSRGNTPWNFIVVTDRQRLARLAAAKVHGSGFLGNAPLAIVVCADMLDLLEKIMILAIVGIGYPMEQIDGHPLSSLNYDRISYECYGLKG